MDGHSLLARVPDTVTLYLGFPRDKLYQFGMVGCGLQLDDSHDFDWASATCTLRRDVDEFLIYMSTRGVAPSEIPGCGDFHRIPIRTMADYCQSFARISQFLAAYWKNRFLRLGGKAHLRPEQLNSQDAFILEMEESDFRRFYLSDPRGILTGAELMRGLTRHPPVLLGGVPPGLPDPETGV